MDTVPRVYVVKRRYRECKALCCFANAYKYVVVVHTLQSKKFFRRV